MPLDPNLIEPSSKLQGNNEVIMVVFLSSLIAISNEVQATLWTLVSTPFNMQTCLCASLMAIGRLPREVLHIICMITIYISRGVIC